jgi:hypothetical protein
VSDSEKKTVPPKAEKRAAERQAFLLPERHPWSKAWQYAAGVGALGFIGSLTAWGDKRFAFSYLFAFQFALSICLGMLFFVLMQHLTSAGWSITVRRTAEFFMSGFVVLAVLFVPVWLKRADLFPWIAQAAHEETHHASGQRTSTTELTQGHAPDPRGAAPGTMAGPGNV